MASDARARLGAADGFTLFELIIVVLIVGILAGIAVPALLGRRVNAGDAAAKSLMNTAAQTANMYVLSSGSATMTPAALKGFEPTINTTANGQAVLVNAAPTASGYLLTVVSSTADTFNIISANGSVTRTCSIAAGNGNTSTNTGGGCTSGHW